MVNIILNADAGWSSKGGRDALVIGASRDWRRVDALSPGGFFSCSFLGEMGAANREVLRPDSTREEKSEFPSRGIPSFFVVFLAIEKVYGL